MSAGRKWWPVAGGDSRGNDDLGADLLGVAKPLSSPDISTSFGRVLLRTARRSESNDS